MKIGSIVMIKDKYWERYLREISRKGLPQLIEKDGKYKVIGIFDDPRIYSQVGLVFEGISDNLWAAEVFREVDPLDGIDEVINEILKTPVEELV